MSRIKDIKDALVREKKINKISSREMLSTGSTLLNLACAGRVNSGFVKGKYYFLVGDSASGKTFLSLTCLAEASINPNFKDYRFIYDNSEDGALMDIQRFFGSAVAKKMEAPATTKEGDPIYSSTIEEFYFHVDDAIKAGKPFIYILDSMDSLTSESEIEKFNELKESHQAGKEAAGSYGDGKAKKNSSNIRRLLPFLRDTGSILIIINQTRDNLGFGFEKKTRSGGHALRFYATVEIWSSIVDKIKKRVKGKDRQIGITCQLQIKKNRITGKERKIEIPIYHSYGIDDTESCVQYLIDEKHWKVHKGIIQAPEFEFEGTIEELISHINEKGLEKDLRSIVGDVWIEIEEQCDVQRKRRYL